MNTLWTGTASVVTALSLLLSGCSKQPEAKVDAGEMTEPMAAPPKPAVDLAHDISSLEQMLVTEKLNERQERDLRKLISGLKESAAARARAEKKQ